MDGALAWVSQIAQWFAQFIPRWEILDPTLAWVKFRRGVFHSAGRAGVVVWWPVTTKVEIHSVAEQTIRLDPQSLTTRDGKDITVQGLIVYEYKDIEKMGTTLVDPDDAVRDKALMVIAMTVSQHDKTALLDAFRTEQLDEDMRGRAQNLLRRRYGVEVIRLGLIQLAGARPYRVISGGAIDLPTTNPQV